MKTFLKPLTSDEEKLYLQRYREGDLEAKNILIEHNLRLVAHVAKKYQDSGEDPEDLLSIGTIGLIKAISTFDAKKSARLSTYAARCIDNELLMMFRSRKKHSREVSLYDPIGTDREGNEISLLDIIESPPVDIVEQYATRQDIRHLITSLKTILTPREYQVICLRYGLFGVSEQTQKTIAQKLSISRSYVSRIEKNALKKLRSLFDEHTETHI
ncbi:RNA polymerase sporulation sigma factor SigK [Blautia sp.]|uniref:RNA polymerase sporulation sigma factor SigK n=1 Tax=Blautia sp. TaxID=1955243 RepID=UPI003AB5DBA6